MKNSKAPHVCVGAMTIDVEDWFQVENLRPSISRDCWNRCELRVSGNIERMLEALGERDLTCTFFVLGWIAEKIPLLIRTLSDAGHEIASHGFGHELLNRMSLKEFHADVTRSKALLEDITGREVLGYRAPSFSITDWAIPILQDLGFRYDSSVFDAIAHDRYGKLTNVEIGHTIFELKPGFTEVCVSCLKVGPIRLPWGGGGYFRLIPYPIFKLGIRRIQYTGEPYVFYLHPWEIDPEQTRVAGLRLTHRFRHYVNLNKCETRWRMLLDDFHWMPIRSLLALKGQSIPTVARILPRGNEHAARQRPDQ